MLDKILKVWIEKEGVILDRNSSFEINKDSRGYVKTVDSISQTIQVGIERKVSLREYQQRYIGTYTIDGKVWQ